MSKYNILFSLEKNLYLDGAPVLLEAGALVSNTESGRVHIQLKFKNLSNTTISMVKVSFVLMDSIGREIGRSKKQYIDLKAKLNESFGDKDPAFLIDNTVRKFSAIIEEICFTDGNIWIVPENAVWEKIPTAQSIRRNLTTSEAIDEFKLVYCKQAQFIPFAHKDLWVCSCGNVNKNAHEKCCSCGANFADMESVDNETLKKNNIYRNATALVNKSVSSEIKKGIALFGCIPGWKDSTTKLEESKQKLILVSQHEKDTQIKNAKQKKKNIIIAALSFVSVVILIIGISIAVSISKANKYEQAQELMAQHKYSEAMSLLDDLEGYKNADELYLRASYMYNGNYKEIVKMDNLTEFVIPEGTTKIADKAFYNCDKLTNITIPDSVTVIGAQAFYKCDKLTNITIPETVSVIGDEAFYGCSKLKSVKIPANVTKIGKSAFSGSCHDLLEVHIEDLAAWCNIDFENEAANPLDACLETYLYINGEKVTDIIIPNGVSKINSYAFIGNKIRTVVIPNSVHTIEVDAFKYTGYYQDKEDGSYGGTTSSTIYCAQSIKPTGWANDWESLCDVIWDYGGKHGETSNGLTWVLTSNNTVTITGCTAKATNVIIPNNIDGYQVNNIESGVFRGCETLTSITIPNWITKIEKNMFARCENLTTVIMHNQITEIGEYAFDKCSRLVAIEIPSSVTKIGNSAFSECINLTGIIIGNSVETIGYGAFYMCENLKCIILPKSVTMVGAKAFYNCWDATIYLETGINSGNWQDGWDEEFISSHKKITNVDDYGVLDNGLIWVYESNETSIVGRIKNIRNLQIPSTVEAKTVTKIGRYAFSESAETTSLTLPNSIITIDHYAFYQCDGLTNITIPNSVVFIGSCSFCGCDNLVNVTIGNSVEKICSGAFGSCDKLEKIIIPNSVKEIRRDCFYGSDSLTIYCRVAAKPSRWDYSWNSTSDKKRINVIWGYTGN